MVGVRVVRPAARIRSGTQPTSRERPPATSTTIGASPNVERSADDEPGDARRQISESGFVSESPSTRSRTQSTVRLDSIHFRGLRDELNKGTGPLADPILHQYLKKLVTLAILANAVSLGLQADEYGSPDVWMVLEHVFTLIFATEMFSKLYSARREYFKDHWNLLDFSLSWMMIVDVWILAQFEDGALASFSSIRIVRLLRMARMLRVLRIKKELVVIVEGLWASMKSMAWIGVLLFVIIYTFAIFCKGIIEYDRYEGMDFDARLYFGTVTGSMMTLFNMCLLDEWSDIMRPVADEQPYMVPFFLSYLMLVTLGVLNLIIGVIAERTMEAGTDLKLAEENMAKRGKMKAIMQMTDDIFEKDTDGGLSVEELEWAFNESPELAETLRCCDLPRGFVVSDLHLMFDQEYGGSVNKDEFINGMFRLVFNDVKQDALCMMLTIAEVKREVKDGLDQMLIDFKSLCLEELGMRQLRKLQDDAERGLETVTPLQVAVPDAALSAALESQGAPRGLVDLSLACAPPPPLVDAPLLPASSDRSRRGRKREEPEVAGDPEYDAIGLEHAELCRQIDASVRVCAAQLRSDFTAQHSDLVLTLKATLLQGLAEQTAGPALVEVPVKQASHPAGALNGVPQRGIARVRAVDLMMEPDPDDPAQGCGCMSSGGNLARAALSDRPRRV